MAAFAQNDSLASPPPPFRQTSAQIIEMREGGGGAALFGLPFLLAGLAMAFTLTRLLHSETPRGGKWALLAFIAMSLAFIGVGAVIVFGRRWLTLDVSRGMLVRSYGLLVPLRTRERLLSEFSAVVIAYDAGDSETPERYPVRLRAMSGQDFAISKPSKFGESRALAEYLARFLRLPLADTTTDHEIVVAPERAGQTLHERLRSGVAETQAPERPVNTRCQVSEAADKTVIVIPSGGGWRSHLLSIVLPLVLLFGFPLLLRLLTRAGAPGLVHFGFYFFLVPIVVLPLIFISVKLMAGSNRKGTTVTASAAGLEIEQKNGRRITKTLVPAADLLDVDCFTAEGLVESVRAASMKEAATPNPGAERMVTVLKRWLPNRGIIVKSRYELISFGEGLPASELQYLTWLLRRQVIGT